MDDSTRAALPAVSVVIPTRNRAAVLEGAVRSVQAQTFADWELVVVDDGSTDGTGVAVAEWMREDPRIRYVRNEPGRGLPGARNVGLAHARAALVACLDDDDRWLPEKLAKQLDVFARSGDPRLAAVYAGVVYEYPDGRTDYHRPVHRGDLTRALLREPYVVKGGFSCLLFRRDAALAVGGFDESLKMREDYEMQLRMSLAGHAFDFVDEPLVRYRADGGDSLSRKSRRRVWGILQVYRKHRRHFDAAGGARHFNELMLASRFLLQSGHRRLAWRVYRHAAFRARPTRLDWPALRDYAALPARMLLSSVRGR